jgi:hypothetical protein
LENPTSKTASQSKNLKKLDKISSKNRNNESIAWNLIPKRFILCLLNLLMALSGGLREKSTLSDELC